MAITAVHFSYLRVCRRKLWLFHHGIQCENDVDNPNASKVSAGRHLSNVAYQRRKSLHREAVFEWEGLRIRPDFFDPQKGILRETKLSSARLDADKFQILFYTYVLNRLGFVLNQIILEYPKEKRVDVLNVDFIEAKQTVEPRLFEIGELVEGACPEPVLVKACKKCSYAYFCFEAMEG